MAKQRAKVGMILECGPDGADVQVCRHLAALLDTHVEVLSVTMNNKPNLIENCGAAAAQLLEDGCARVLIIWDLFPAWRERGLKPCRHKDREQIFLSLQSAGVSRADVHLICIREELEAWLIADGRAVSAVLSTPTHPVRGKDGKNAERILNPKKVLNRLFQRHSGRPYVDRRHARQIVEQLPDLGRLEKLPTFRRFCKRFLGVE